MARNSRGGLRGFVASVFRPPNHDAADSIGSALEASAEGIGALNIGLVTLGLTITTATAMAPAETEPVLGPPAGRGPRRDPDVGAAADSGTGRAIPRESRHTRSRPAHQF